MLIIVSILQGSLIECQLCSAAIPTLSRDSILSFLLGTASNVLMILMIQIPSKSLLRWVPPPRLPVNRCLRVSLKNVSRPLIVLRILGDQENLPTRTVDQCTIVTAIKDSTGALTAKSPNSKPLPPDAEPIPKDRLSLIMLSTMSTKLRFPSPQTQKRNLL